MELFENKLIVANTGSDSLSVIDIDNYSLIDTINLSEMAKTKGNRSISSGPIIGPHHIYFSKNNILYSANSYNNSVYKINIKSKKIEDMVFVGSFPSHLVVHNGYIYVTNSDSNSISVIDEEEFKVIENIPVGERPHDIKVDKANNRLYISNNNGYSIDMFDLNLGIEKRINLKYNPVHILIDKSTMFILSPPTNSILYSKVIVFCLNEEKIVKEIQVEGVTVDLVTIEGKKTIYVTNVETSKLYEIDLEKDIINCTYFIGGMPNKIIRKNDKLYISDALNNRVAIFNYKLGKLVCSIDVGIEPNGLVII